MGTDLMITGLLQGLILALVTYGIMIPFRILHFADLTAEGAYPLGGVLCTTALLSGLHPLAALGMAAIAAGCMGMATAYIHLKLKINTLLAGIILSTMAYSVSLRIMGKPNIALFDVQTLFEGQPDLENIAIVLVCLILLVIPLYLFLQTEIGLKLRAVGLNPDFAKRQGISIRKYTLLGLFLGGCFTGLAGGLMVQLQNYMDIGMGIGIVIHGLAALMIGEAIVGNNTLQQQLLAPLVGALVYQQIQGIVLSIGLAPSDLKFFTGSIVLLVIAFKAKRSILHP